MENHIYRHRNYKRKRIITWIIILGLFGIMFYGITFVTTQKKDELTEKCESDLEYYIDISEKKFGITISILKTEKINDLQTAREFVKTWRSVFTLASDIPPEYDNYSPKPSKPTFPIVVYAIRIEGQGGTLPYVIVCGNDGKIMEWSKRVLLLSV